MRCLKFSSKVRFFLLTFAPIVLLSNLAHAVTVNYGNLPGLNVNFLNVAETTSTSDFFGTPDAAVNSIDFDPTGHGAYANGVGGNDTGSTSLSFMVLANPMFAITGISFRELGDTTLAGVEANSTKTLITNMITITITEVDGSPIAPLSIVGSLAFSPSGGTYDIPTDAPGKYFYNSIFDGNLAVNINQALVNASINFALGATKLNVTTISVANAMSQAGTAALINVKDFYSIVDVVKGSSIPEPATALLLGVGLFSAARVRRRYSR